jgi:hypothetical protein
VFKALGTEPEISRELLDNLRVMFALERSIDDYTTWACDAQCAAVSRVTFALPRTDPDLRLASRDPSHRVRDGIARVACRQSRVFEAHPRLAKKRE